MNKKTLVLALALVVLLTGSFTAYNNLTAGAGQPSMTVTAPSVPSAAAPTAQSSEASAQQEPVPLPDAVMIDKNKAEFRQIGRASCRERV